MTQLDMSRASAARSRTAKRPARQGRKATRRDPLALFATPAVLAVAAIVIVPVVVSVGMSFTDYDGLSSANWVGWDNFRSIFADEQLRASLLNTAKIGLFVLVGQNLAGMAMALALESRFRGRPALKAGFFLPVILSSVVVGYLWQYIYTPDGALNQLLGLVGLDSWARPWLGDPDTALWAIGITVIWQSAGFSMIIYSAGLQNVRKELLEAAQLDGAGWLAQFRHVKLPALTPAITISVALSLISSLRLFDQVIAMTDGGPGYATETVSSVMFKEGFVQSRFGLASALSVVLCLIIFAVAGMQVALTRRRETEV